MIDQAKLAEVKVLLREGQPAKDPLRDVPERELRKLRSEIDALLPRDTLNDMDLPTELIRQFQKVKDLQDSVIDDDEIAPNQRAQCAGQVASTLQQLVKMQTDFYNSERFRAIENLMIKYMKGLPLAQAEAFLADYEKVGRGNV